MVCPSPFQQVVSWKCPLSGRVRTYCVLSPFAWGPFLGEDHFWVPVSNCHNYINLNNFLIIQWILSSCIFIFLWCKCMSKKIYQMPRKCPQLNKIQECTAYIKGMSHVMTWFWDQGSWRWSRFEGEGPSMSILKTEGFSMSFVFCKWLLILHSPATGPHRVQLGEQKYKEKLHPQWISRLVLVC